MSTADTVREITRATRAHGVTTTRTLALSQDRIDAACAAGLLNRRHLGVYVNPAVLRTPLQDLAAAVAAGGAMAAAWGRSAAALWALLDDYPPTPEIVIPVKRRARLNGVIVHRSVDLCWNHLGHRRGIRTTNPLVTVLDLGVTLDCDSIAEVIVRGGAQRLFTLDAAKATVVRLARSGRTGVLNVRSALDLLDGLGRPLESVLELRFLLLAQRHALPEMEFQHQVRIGRRTFRIDAAYPELKLAIEIDGYEMRSSPEAFAADIERQNALVLEGWTILRFPWSRVVGDAAGVAADILRALRTLSRDLHG
jgi:very-short-patch-repair endonuclease